MHRILSVDDEPINQIIVEEIFSDRYDVRLASSGEECLNTVDDIQPQLILLDVSMSGMDGYTTSLLLKERQNTKNIPVIFVSARSTLEDKIKGYEAGGHDYITKPFDQNELAGKINQLINHAAEQPAVSPEYLLKSDNFRSESNHSAAGLAMIGDFLHHSLHCDSPEELADALLDMCNYFGLNCILQLRMDSTVLNRSSVGQVTPLESSLIADALAQNRVFDFGSQTIISYPHISLLIKNMPDDQSMRYQETKHILSLIMAGAESRLATVKQSEILKNRQSQLFDTIKRNMSEFDFHDQKLKKQYISLLENLSEQIKMSCYELGLTDSEEQLIQSKTHETLEKAKCLLFDGISLEERLKIIKHSLK